MIKKNTTSLNHIFLLSDMIKNILGDIKITILNSNSKKSNVSLLSKIKKISIIFLILFPISLILIALINTFLFIINIKFPVNYTQKFIEYNGFLYSLFSYVLYTPVIEELGFRLGLRYSRINFSIMASCLIYFFFIVVHPSILDFFKPVNSYFINIAIALTLGMVTLFSLKFSEKTNNYIANFWSNHNKLIFYISVFLFAFFHYFNFELNLKTLLLMPLITLPQTMYGIAFGYVRLKYGIFSSIILHSIVNMVAFTPTLIDYIK